jgi:hypothetical protein
LDGALTVTVMPAASAPAARLARVQVTTPEAWLHVHPLPEALTNDAAPGSVSVTVRLDALLGPAFATTSV